ncbi:MAG: CHAT domain-containing protein, partial [Anaerolineae bacterium]
VLVANPDLSDYPHLAPLNVEDELERARCSLDGIPVTVLASTTTSEPLPQGRASLEDLLIHLRDGYDILYLVCHGTLVGGEPTLWLEDKEGNVERVSGNRFVAGLSKLSSHPRLIVLASCQSAGSGRETHAALGNALSALGPRLAEACIPAVVAMQGDVAMETAAEFMSVFFHELSRDGQIDRAMAAARNHVQAPGSDWWRPALFMRLKSGRIWYTPGFGGDAHEIETWPPLLDAIEGDEEDSYCTPILGPGLTDPLLGSHREIARQWAEELHFPMAYHCREDLSQVAQYLAVLWQDRPLRNHLRKHLWRELLERCGPALPGDSSDGLLQALHEFVQSTSAQGAEFEPLEPYRILAQLPFRIYITADPTNLLEETLIAAGKEPQHRVCPWREEIRPADYEFDDTPSVHRPLVYYLLGSFHRPQSLVLTEDNCYDFLIGITARKDRIPLVVRSALAEHELLFLGFRIQERGFRVLLRAIMNCEGRTAAPVPSVAAQVYPEEDYAQEPERARRYLERYFQTAKINIYWGSAGDFVRELGRRWQERGGKL